MSAIPYVLAFVTVLSLLTAILGGIFVYTLYRRAESERRGGAAICDDLYGIKERLAEHIRKHVENTAAQTEAAAKIEAHMKRRDKDISAIRVNLTAAANNLRAVRWSIDPDHGSQQSQRGESGLPRTLDDLDVHEAAKAINLRKGVSCTSSSTCAPHKYPAPTSPSSTPSP